MAPDDPPRVFLTGPPGCGKSTVIIRVLQLMKAVPAAGFYTREIRQCGTRVGFEAVGLTGKSVTLAHTSFPRRHRVGKYGVDTEAFEVFLAHELGSPAEHARLIVLDEVGKMECLSTRFVAMTRELLSADQPILGTIAERGEGLIAELKRRADLQLLRVDTANRDILPAQLAERFSVC